MWNIKLFLFLCSFVFSFTSPYILLYCPFGTNNVFLIELTTVLVKLWGCFLTDFLLFNNKQHLHYISSGFELNIYVFIYPGKNLLAGRQVQRRQLLKKIPSKTITEPGLSLSGVWDEPRCSGTGDVPVEQRSPTRAGPHRNNTQLTLFVFYYLILNDVLEHRTLQINCFSHFLVSLCRKTHPEETEEEERLQVKETKNMDFQWHRAARH